MRELDVGSRGSRSGRSLLPQLREPEARCQGARHRQDREEQDSPLRRNNAKSLVQENSS